MCGSGESRKVTVPSPKTSNWGSVCFTGSWPERVVVNSTSNHLPIIPPPYSSRLWDLDRSVPAASGCGGSSGNTSSVVLLPPCLGSRPQSGTNCSEAGVRERMSGLTDLGLFEVRHSQRPRCLSTTPVNIQEQRRAGSREAVVAARAPSPRAMCEMSDFPVRPCGGQWGHLARACARLATVIH